MAGGGLKMGQAVGARPCAANVRKDRPISVTPQLLSTIYRTIGIDPAMTFPNGNGRPMYILDDRDPVKELLVTHRGRCGVALRYAASGCFLPTEYYPADGEFLSAIRTKPLPERGRSWPSQLLTTVAALLMAEPKESTAGESAPPPKPAEVLVSPPTGRQITLGRGVTAQQLIITATLAGNRLADLTGDAEYDIADKKIVRILPGGRVLPLASGRTEIVARYGDHTAKVAVEAQSIEENLPINFGNQIVPIFTKLGCNSGGCHGKASGQNGFKLSLLGFEPEVDYGCPVRGRAAVASIPRCRTKACCCSRPRAAWLTAAASAWRSTPTSTRAFAAGSPPVCPSGSRAIPW